MKFQFMQYAACCAGALSLMNDAMYISWPSPSLPKLSSPESPIGKPLTLEEKSWIASSLYLSAFVSIFLSRWLVENVGRKNTALLSAIPLFLPWVIITFSKSAVIIILARFVGSIGGQMALTAITMYIGEISETTIRGKLSVVLTIFKLTGNLFVLGAGPFISYKALALSCGVVPVFFAIAFSMMPESPYYFMKISKRDLARKNLIKLTNGSFENTTLEQKLFEIEESVKSDMKNKTTVIEFLTRLQYRRAIFITLGAITFQELTGISTIAAYMQTIIQISKSDISPEHSSILFGAVQIPAVLTAAVLIDKLGRRFLLMISSLGCAIALLGEGIYFYLLNRTDADLKCISWLPTSLLVLFLIMNPIGLNILPYVLLGELFPINIKSTAIPTFILYGSCLAFVISKFFEPLSEIWGMHTMFWFYAFMCVLSFLFALFVLPETKGKSFTEIQSTLVL